uniref:Uncharacterized protein n=1 Tax=Romanomermis culicivorax TaxID=13658 RepID=A0A915IYB5_ROMCU
MKDQISRKSLLIKYHLEKYDQLHEARSLMTTLFNPIKINEIDLVISSKAAFAETPPAASIISKWMKYRQACTNASIVSVVKKRQNQKQTIVRETGNRETEKQTVVKTVRERENRETDCRQDRHVAQIADYDENIVNIGNISKVSKEITINDKIVLVDYSHFQSVSVQLLENLLKM